MWAAFVSGSEGAQIAALKGREGRRVGPPPPPPLPPRVEQGKGSSGALPRRLPCSLHPLAMVAVRSTGPRSVGAPVLPPAGGGEGATP